MYGQVLFYVLVRYVYLTSFSTNYCMCMSCHYSIIHQFLAYILESYQEALRVISWNKTAKAVAIILTSIKMVKYIKNIKVINGQINLWIIWGTNNKNISWISNKKSRKMCEDHKMSLHHVWGTEEKSRNFDITKCSLSSEEIMDQISYDLKN